MSECKTEFEKMVEFLDAAWILKDQIVPCLVGPVGIGKTAAVMKHAENVKANKVVEIIASQILPNEVSGITMPDSDSKAMEIYDHYRLSSLEDGDILFFDELLEADQMVLSACLTLIESRQMMSGKKLPDIQIIAATNPTIQPNMLKENIRQRFMFKKFSIDREGCYKFIKEDCGISIPADILTQIKSTGDEYNILSQRSLTKIARWMAKAKELNNEVEVANVIDSIWGCGIGSAILNEINRQTPEMRAKSVITDLVYRSIFDNEDGTLVKAVGADDLTKLRDPNKIATMNFTEILGILKKFPNWDDIEEKLSNSMLEVKDNCDLEF